MSRLRLPFVLIAALLLTHTLAQGDWFETGSLTTVIGGEERLLRTYGTWVPEDVADGVEDPDQRRLLESVAGTEQHTATHQLTPEMSMGGIVLTPATLWVALTFRYDGHDSTGPHGVTMQFALDPQTLELLDPDDLEITYYPEGPSWDDYYALTDGSLTLHAVEVVDEVTLRISGSFEGYMTHQTGWDVVHDPATSMAASGQFVVERVVGSTLALEAILGDQ